MQEGSPFDIYHHPANIFVAEFIGDPGINLFTGKITNGALDCGDFSVPLPDALANRVGRLVAGIRPEKIEVSETAKEGWQEVRTEILQPTGANTILEVRTGDTPITLLQPGFITLPDNTSLWINFDPDALSFFDIESQDNLRNAAG